MEEVQINPKIQDSLDLWQHIRAYDKENAASQFIPVLSKKQKQQVKKLLQMADQTSEHPVMVPTDTAGSAMATSSPIVETDVNLKGSAPHGARCSCPMTPSKTSTRPGPLASYQGI
uniref:Uncharacterized protein n=1 Tax=Medicago truncatula TaxID=3880 RepID=Q2HTW8_MEDTR|nr:hypothetical protein MtrDRAFT_AC149601g9v2 [Medicago truncatula]